MRTKAMVKIILNLSLMALFFWSFCSEIKAQTQPSFKGKEFEITIEKTDKGIKLHSSKGSAWIDLSFSSTIDKPQAIDEYGMTSLDKVSKDKDPKLADYLFTITRTKTGIKLIGQEGTAWKELSFTLPQNGKKTFGPLGMID